MSYLYRYLQCTEKIKQFFHELDISETIVNFGIDEQFGEFSVHTIVALYINNMCTLNMLNIKVVGFGVFFQSKTNLFNEKQTNITPHTC